MKSGKIIAGALGTAASVAGALMLTNRRFVRKAEASVPADGQIISVGEDKIHYTDEGQGPAILMIHGLGGQMRNFGRPLVDALAQDHRVIRVDRPGSGYSVRPGGCPASLSRQAEIIAELITVLDLEKPLVVGHSLGGALGLTLALEHPDKVGSLALICPLTQDVPIEDLPEAFKGLVIRSPLVRRMVANSVATPLSLALQDKVLGQIFGPEPVPDNFPVEGGGALALRPNAFFENSSDLCALEGEMAPLVSRYGELALPVSILFAEGDQILDPELHGGVTRDQIEGSRLEMIAGGHMLPFTQPVRVAAWLLREIDRVRAEQAPQG